MYFGLSTSLLSCNFDGVLISDLNLVFLDLWVVGGLSLDLYFGILWTLIVLLETGLVVCMKKYGSYPIFLRKVMYLNFSVS